jgi:tetratricopeptide (TPR) repeat protein
VLATHDRQEDAATPNAERARVLDNLSVVVRECGDAKAAEAYARRGLSDWTSLRGRADPDTATAMGGLAAALLEQGRLDEAAPLLDEARRFFATHDHRLALGSVLTLVGSLALRRGDRDAARAAFTEALVATQEVLPEHHPEVRALQASLRAIG